MNTFVVVLLVFATKCHSILFKNKTLFDVEIPNCTMTNMDRYERLESLYMHNLFRSTLANGNQQNGRDPNNKFPTAANMNLMLYDCELEESAYNISKLCQNVSPNFSYLGSNNATITVYTEIDKLFIVGLNDMWNTILHNDALVNLTPKFNDTKIIPFLQMANGATRTVGCSFSKCSFGSIYTILYVCVYGQSHVQVQAPLYMEGPQCSKCAGNCVDYLCNNTAFYNLHKVKEALADANRKLNELDLGNTHLAGEIRDLQTALKEGDAQRHGAENGTACALAELQALRIEMERRLQEKGEEVEAIRKKMQFEIDRLTAALADAEDRNNTDDLKTRLNELTQQRQRLQAENNDLLKEVHDQKVQLDNLQHVNFTLSQQLDEARRRLKDIENLHSQLRQVQLELDSVRTALDEECAARSDAEQNLNLTSNEITQWKIKFDVEVALHHEEVEDILKKMLQKQAEYQNQTEIMLQKISQLEKAKSRLQSVGEVPVADLDKAQNTIAILERAKEQLEKPRAQLKNHTDQLGVELEAAQRELRTANAELQKMKNLYEKAVEQKELFDSENKKPCDDLHEAKEALADANRKLNELDLRNTGLVDEIRDLQTALKESDAQRRDAENRIRHALSGLKEPLRIEMERRLQEKEKEMETLRKDMQCEIDRLTAANGSDASMKAEIARLKKKYQAEIAELENTVDNINRTNIEAQKTIKKQSEQLKVLQASLEDTQCQLQHVLDQYALAQRKVAALSGEHEDVNGGTINFTDITGNIDLVENKLETELSTAQADLDEVKQLQVQIQEAEAAALLGGKRVIAKLETRIRDLETALDQECCRDKENQTSVHKKDCRISGSKQVLDEEHKNYVMAQDTADRLLEKLNIQKRQLGDAKSKVMANLQRVRRYQREFEDTEGGGDQAESSLHLIRAKHRSSVVTEKPEACKVHTMENE